MDNESVGTWIELERRAKSEERRAKRESTEWVIWSATSSTCRESSEIPWCFMVVMISLMIVARAASTPALSQHSAFSIRGFMDSDILSDPLHAIQRIKESDRFANRGSRKNGRMESKETENREDLVDVVRVGRIAPDAASAEHVQEVVALDVQRVGTGLLLVLLDYHAVDVLEPLYYSQFTLLFLSHKEFRFIIEQGNIYVSN